MLVVSVFSSVFFAIFIFFVFVFFISAFLYFFFRILSSGFIFYVRLFYVLLFMYFSLINRFLCRDSFLCIIILFLFLYSSFIYISTYYILKCCFILLISFSCFLTKSQSVSWLFCFFSNSSSLLKRVEWFSATI